MYQVTVTRGPKAGKTYTYKTLRAASRACDRLDNEYGAYCSSYRRVSYSNPFADAAD